MIKSMGEALKHTKGLTGGAILGDGRVGLILDIAGIFELSDKQGLEGVRSKAEGLTNHAS